MKRKTTKLLEAVLVIAVTLAFVMPASVAITNSTQADEKIQNTFFGDSATHRDKEKVCSYEKSDYSPLGEGVDVRLTGDWNTGDDILPSVTRDDDGYTVVSWTNEIGVGEATMGFLYSDNPTDPSTWLGGTYMLGGISELRYVDTATCDHPDYDLMGVFLSLMAKSYGFDG